jgi:hypothetical protein
MKLTKQILALSVMLLINAESNAGIAIVVDPRIKIDAISQSDAADLFLKRKIARAADVELMPVDQKGKKLEFYKKVVGKDEGQLNGYWSQMIFTGKKRPPKLVVDDNMVKKFVTLYPGSVGYIDSASVDSSVKVIYQSD